MSIPKVPLWPDGIAGWNHWTASPSATQLRVGFTPVINRIILTNISLRFTKQNQKNNMLLVNKSGIAIVNRTKEDLGHDVVCCRLRALVNDWCFNWTSRCSIATTAFPDCIDWNLCDSLPMRPRIDVDVELTILPIRRLWWMFDHNSPSLHAAYVTHCVGWK